MFKTNVSGQKNWGAMPVATGQTNALRNPNHEI